MRSTFRTNDTPIYLLGKMYNGKEGKSLASMNFQLNKSEDF